MVKLTRTLSIVSTVLIFAFVHLRLKRKAMPNAFGPDAEGTKIRFVSLFPWFILGFAALAAINSVNVIPTAVGVGEKN